MKQNFFPTLSEGLDAVAQYLLDNKATEAAGQSFRENFAYGGVKYVETRRSFTMLDTYKGKPCKRRALGVTVYRMESGTYEVLAYIS